MKKVILGIALIALIAGGIIFFIPVEAGENAEFLRIHIRANSNTAEDQDVKIAVKDAVVEFLVPLLATVTSKEDARRVIDKNNIEIAKVAEKALEKNGFSYGARATVQSEDFPTRNYGDITLPSGLYDALVVKLGTGEGDNWWCVAFPPLCFTPNGNGKNIVYKSKIVEIIEKWKENYAKNS